MPKCRFEIVNQQRDGTYVMSCMGDIVRVAGQPKFGRECDCDLDHSDCAARGEEVRREKCDGCRGAVQVKVFACELKNECTLSSVVPGIACCALCREYVAPTASPTAPQQQSPE